MPLNVDNIVSHDLYYGVAVKNKRRSPSLQSLTSECGTPCTVSRGKEDEYS
jgi:hypothetical protein